MHTLQSLADDKSHGAARQMCKTRTTDCTALSTIACLGVRVNMAYWNMACRVLSKTALYAIAMAYLLFIV